MRRVVTGLVLIVLAIALVACSAPADTGTSGSSGATSTAGSGVAVTPPASGGAASGSASGDILSPTQTVGVNEMFPTDSGTVPSSIAADLTAKKPMLIFYYDPALKATADTRAEIDAVMKKYRGTIDLFALDYTTGIPASSASSTTLDAETQKVELLAAALGVTTTPYIVFVDSSGRVTYKFAGFVDRSLLTREVLRATE